MKDTKSVEWISVFEFVRKLLRCSETQRFFFISQLSKIIPERDDIYLYSDWLGDNIKCQNSDATCVLSTTLSLFTNGACSCRLGRAEGETQRF